jgi:uncharacterized protein
VNDLGSPGSLLGLKGGPEVAADAFRPSLQVRLLVMQPTPFCNLDCTYCYLPARHDKRRLSIPTVEAAIRNVIDSGLLGPELTVIWHAGEPLVMPPEFYAQAFERIAVVVAGRAQVHHSMQTNGTLIDDAWCELFRAWSVRVGISIDGPARIHDRHRKTRSGRGTHRAVMRGARRMCDADLPFYAIVVVTAESVDEPDAILDFFEQAGIADIGLNLEEQEGINSRASLADADERVARFYRRVCERMTSSHGRLRIREFEQARDALLCGLPVFAFGERRYVENEQVRPFEIVSVDWEGNFSTFSPELLGQRHPRFDGFALGNVHRTRLIDVLGTPRFRELFGEIIAGVERCARECSYYFLCGGGAPVNKLFENGRFDSAETEFCRNGIQRPLDAALEALEALASKPHSESAS